LNIKKNYIFQPTSPLTGFSYALLHQLYL